MIDLYGLHSEPHTLYGYDKAYEVIPCLAWNKYKRKVQRKKREDLWAQDPEIAYQYARDIIKGRFPKGEDAIAKDAWSAFSYAYNVIQGRFRKGEDAIATDPEYAYRYAYNIIKGRWKKGEPIILSTDNRYKHEYLQMIK